MALKYSKRDPFSMYGMGDQKTSLELFTQVERRLKAKEEALDDMQNEYNLLQKQALNTYKGHIYYGLLYEGTIKKASRWIHMLRNNKDADGNKLDKRRKYEEKDTFTFLQEHLNDLFEVDDLVITKIMDYNFGEAGEIEFTSQGHKWMLKVPYVENIKLDTYQREGYYCFILSLYNNDEDHIRSLVGSTYEEKDLKNILAEGIKEVTEDESE